MGKIVGLVLGALVAAVIVLALRSQPATPVPPAIPDPDGPGAPDAPAEPPVAKTPEPTPEPKKAPEAEAPKTPDEAKWDRRLAREDEILVEQAKAAGVDAARAEKLAAILAEKRAARARTLEEHKTGRITQEEMMKRAAATKKAADAQLKTLLSPTELEALDPEGARLKVLEEEGKKGR